MHAHVTILQPVDYDLGSLVLTGNPGSRSKRACAVLLCAVCERGVWFVPVEEHMPQLVELDSLTVINIVDNEMDGNSMFFDGIFLQH